MSSQIEGPRFEQLLAEIRGCRICADSLPLGPRPIIQACLSSRILIIGQAPGARVHDVGRPWADASGDRLRDWLGVSEDQFYDPDIFALMPMGLCYPGSGKSGDLPPRKECAPQWHAKVLAELKTVRLTILVGQYAQARYLDPGRSRSMTDAVRDYAKALPRYFPLPHPSWRSTMWQRRNPWFETITLPALRSEVTKAVALA